MASGTRVVPEMMGVYNDLLGKNVKNYSNMLGAYSEGQERIGAAAPGISAAYGYIGDQVRNDLGMGAALGENGNWGVASPAARAIRDNQIQSSASIDQAMINRGLGNSTVRSNLQSQAASDASNAYGNLGAQLADKAAGYRERIGLAQQAAQMQTLGMQTQLSQAKGGALANYSFANTAGGLLGQYSDGGGGGGAIGGFGGVRSSPSDQGSPTGYRSSVAGPGASHYGSSGGMQIGGDYAWSPPNALPLQTGFGGFPPQMDATGYPTGYSPQAEATGYPGAGTPRLDADYGDFGGDFEGDWY